MFHPSLFVLLWFYFCRYAPKAINKTPAIANRKTCFIVKKIGDGIIQTQNMTFHCKACGLPVTIEFSTSSPPNPLNLLNHGYLSNS